MSHGKEGITNTTLGFLVTSQLMAVCCRLATRATSPTREGQRLRQVASLLIISNNHIFFFLRGSQGVKHCPAGLAQRIVFQQGQVLKPL